MNEKFKNLIHCFENLPSVGRKSAMKFAYFITTNKIAGLALANAIEESVKFLKSCEICGNIAEDEICEICADTRRDHTKICIVESSKDILVLEESKFFDGLYFVINDDLQNSISMLKNMIVKFNATEIIFALTPGLGSDSIMIFIEDKLKSLGIKFSKIAQGIPTGVSLENVDLLSLMKAINERKEF